MKSKTCCFTGHRILSAEQSQALAGRIERAVRLLYARGVCYFGAGGALGFDTLAAEEVLCQRKTHPNIRLHLMLPCKGQEKKWRLGDRMRYQRITRQADEVTCLAEEYYDGCMLKRNREMINISAHCVVYCTKPKGGTVYTANRAEQAGLHMIYLMQR